jgi:prolyl-tRNA editing enzyme YbaK/EbsC (Cys-tRNA(Pro) deacylase)
MVLIAGPGQVDWKALRRHLGAHRLTMASETEVLAVTGYPPGAVAPLGVAHPLKILIDRSLLSHQEISLGSGTRGVAVIMQAGDLMRVLRDGEIGDFAQQSLS